jgi:hypothetical protein
LRRTKIIATLGPACISEEMIDRLPQFILRSGATKDLAANTMPPDPSLRSG